jgi:hypothetical protein
MHSWSKRREEQGSVLFFIIIVVAIVAGGYYFLFRLKHSSQLEGQQFARDVVEHVAFQHDVKYLHSVIAPERRIAFPPATEQDFINTFSRLGTPARDYTLSGDLTFERYFFSPQGTFKGTLTYPDRHATVYVSIAKAGGYWVLRDLGITWERPAE